LLTNLFKSLIEFTRLVDIKIILDLSFFIFSRILIVPSKFVSMTFRTFFFESSTAASAQQSIIKSNLGKSLIFWLFQISYLKFLIFNFFKLLRLKLEPFLERLSKENTLKFLSFKKIHKFVPTNPQPPVIKIFIFFKVMIYLYFLIHFIFKN